LRALPTRLVSLRTVPLCPQLRFYSPSVRQHSIGKMAKMGVVLEKARVLAGKIDKETRLDDSAIKVQYQGKVNPMSVVENDMVLLNDNIRKQIATQHPVLSTAAQYYFNLSGKRMRPVVILLIARAISHHIATQAGSYEGEGEVTWKQTQLAEIVEMIHTASLVHDDIIDEALTRRQQPSINVSFGNKASVLVGDFLLARASLMLSELRSFEVTDLMSRVISDLVEGEFMQLKTTDNLVTNFENYIQKTYYKTASLIANGCRASAVLCGSDQTPIPASLIDIATQYGNHFGLAFQLFDDVLDFTGTQEQLGKPAGNDMKCGVITAPALYATSEFPELIPMMERGFSVEGDLPKAYEIVHKSKGIEKTRQLANEHIEKAISQLNQLSDSKAKQALLDIAKLVVNRSS